MNTQSSGSSGARLFVGLGIITVGLGVAAGTALVYFTQPARLDAPVQKIVREPPPVDAPQPAPPPPPPAAPEVDPEALAARAQGLEALYAERYDEAIRYLIRAAAAKNAPPDADDLLGLARRLRRKSEVKPDEEPTPAPRRSRPTRASSRRSVARRAAPDTKRDGTGQIIIVTRPPGLTIYVDGEPRDITPAKLTVSPGRHRIQIRLAQRELLRRIVRVAAGEVEAVDADLTDEFRDPEPTISSAPGDDVRRAALANDDRLNLVGLINPNAAPDKAPVDGDGQLDLVELIERDPSRARKPSADQLDAEGNLDLVGLIEPQGRVRGDAPPDRVRGSALAARTSARATDRSKDRAELDPDGENGRRSAASRPKMYVYVPAGGDGLRRGFRRHLVNVDIEVFSSEAGLKTRAAQVPPDVVVGSPSLLQSLGWAAQLSTEGGGSATAMAYLVSKSEPLVRAKWAQSTVGIVSAKPRADAARSVQRQLGLPRPPKIRKVSKTDDLLPLLQFDMVDAVLVDAQRLPRLKNRTKLSLATQEVSGAKPIGRLAAGFSNAASRDEIEQKLLGLKESARAEMGTGKWVRK